MTKVQKDPATPRDLRVMAGEYKSKAYVSDPYLHTAYASLASRLHACMPSWAHSCSPLPLCILLSARIFCLQPPRSRLYLPETVSIHIHIGGFLVLPSPSQSNPFPFHRCIHSELRVSPWHSVVSLSVRPLHSRA